MNLERLKKLHTGHVLQRPTQKVKMRIVKPKKNKNCEICGKLIEKGTGAVKTEMGGSVTVLLECFDCYLERP